MLGRSKKQRKDSATSNDGGSVSDLGSPNPSETGGTSLTSWFGKPSPVIPSSAKPNRWFSASSSKRDLSDIASGNNIEEQNVEFAKYRIGGSSGAREHHSYQRSSVDKHGSGRGKGSSQIPFPGDDTEDFHAPPPPKLFFRRPTLSTPTIAPLLEADISRYPLPQSTASLSPTLANNKQPHAELVALMSESHSSLGEISQTSRRVLARSMDDLSQMLAASPTPTSPKSSTKSMTRSPSGLREVPRSPARSQRSYNKPAMGIEDEITSSESSSDEADPIRNGSPTISPTAVVSDLPRASSLSSNGSAIPWSSFLSTTSPPVHNNIDKSPPDGPTNDARKSSLTSSESSPMLSSHPFKKYAPIADSVPGSSSKNPFSALLGSSSAPSGNRKESHKRTVSTGFSSKTKEKERLKEWGDIQRMHPSPSTHALSSHLSPSLLSTSTLHQSNSTSTNSSSHLLPEGTTSQAVVHFGLLLRHSAPPTKGALRVVDFSKSWKPYKVVLKSNKLYFFKPPNQERKMEIESKFPTAPVKEEKVEVAVVDESLKPFAHLQMDSLHLRKASIVPGPYFGTGLHPDLLLFTEGQTSDSNALSVSLRESLQAGTPEALVHEMIFSNITPGADPSFEDFTEAVVFSSPAFVTLKGIANVMERCAQAAMEMMTDPEAPSLLLEKVRERVEHAVRVICRSYITTSEKEILSSELKAAVNLLVDRERMSREGSRESPLSVGERMQLSQSIETIVLNIPRKSPTDWILAFKTDPRFTSTGKPDPITLLTSDLTSAIFLQTDAVAFAISLRRFHLDLFSSLFEAEYSSLSDVAKVTNEALHEMEAYPNRPHPLNILSFSPDSPHFLTWIVLNHIFAPSKHSHSQQKGLQKRTDPSLQVSSQSIVTAAESAAAESSSNGSSSKAPSATHTRALIIQHWIAVAENSRIRGDAVGFVAIAMAVCSRPVSRLTQTWRRIPEFDRGIVSSSWVPVLQAAGYLDQEDASIEPILLIKVESKSQSSSSSLSPIPYLGTLIQGVIRSRKKLLTPGDPWVSLPPLWQSMDYVREAHRFIEKAHDSAGSSEAKGSSAELMAYFQKLSIGVSPKSSMLKLYMKPSLGCEPVLLGQAIELKSKISPANVADPKLVIGPLLFPEPLPVISLIDRDAILESSYKLALPKSSSSASLASVARGPSSMSASASTMVNHSIGLHSGGGKKFVRSPRPQSRVESLDLADTGASEKLNQALDSSKRKMFFGSLKDIGGVGDTLIRVCEGQLVLKVVLEPPKKKSTSRPMSFAEPSTATKRTSANFRNSLVLVSNRRNSTPAIGIQQEDGSRPKSMAGSVFERPKSLAGSVFEPLDPLRVTVKSGSMENLIDVLIFGVDGLSSAVKDDNGETSKSSRKLAIDLDEYRTVFFSTFRSFCTPVALFQFFQKRFKAVPEVITNASRPSLTTHNSFPFWKVEDVGSASDTGPDWSSASALRQAVLTTVGCWLEIGGGSQDVLDNPEIFGLLCEFFEFANSEVKTSAVMLPAEVSYRNQVRSTLKAVHKIFTSAALRPTLDPPRSAASAGSKLLASTPSTKKMINIDTVQPSELVNWFDGIATSIYKKISESDLHVAAEILEMQCLDNEGWYSSAVGNQLQPFFDEETVVQDLHSLLLQPLRSPVGLPDSSLSKRLPMSLRYMLRAQAIVRHWLVLQVADPGIDLLQRCKRIEMLLSSLEICRARCVDPESTWTSKEGFTSPGVMNTFSNTLEPTITSFVASAITAALISPECRLFTKAWQTISVSRANGGLDSLTALLKDLPGIALYGVECTVDLAWLLERIAEIVSQVPDMVEQHDNGTAGLINFEKRRYLFNLISNSSGLASSLSFSDDRAESDKLSAIDKAVSGLTYDFRVLRDQAGREALVSSNALTQSHPTRARVFQTVVQAQMDKTRRDHFAHERISRDKKLDALKADKGHIDSNHVFLPKRMSKPASKGTRVGSLLRNFRPLSVAAGHNTDHTAVSPSLKSLEELDFLPSSKPSLVLSIVNSTVTDFPNPIRSFLFQVVTEEGAAHVLQAPTRQDHTLWMERLEAMSRLYAEKRLTLISEFPQKDLMEAVGGDKSKKTEPLSSTAVFEIPLSKLLEKEGKGVTDIPSVVEKLLLDIETRGLEEQGIYRIPGMNSVINGTRDAFNKGLSPDLSSLDIHAVCGVFKLWIRQLPEPVLPFNMYMDFVQAAQIKDYEEKLYRIRELIWNLPKEHFTLLRRIITHLDAVTDNEMKNQMSPESLAIVFAPSLLKAPSGGNSFALTMSNLGHATNLVKNLILSYHWLFDEIAADDEIDRGVAEVDEGSSAATGAADASQSS